MIGDAGWIQESAQRLVAIPSVSGSEMAAQAEVERLMRDVGGVLRQIPVDAQRLKSEYAFSSPTVLTGSHATVAEWGEHRAGAPYLVLNGHVDTVPAGDGWSTGPLDPYVSDGQLFGLGSADMKAGLVGALAGVARALAAGLDGVHLEVQSVPDEEAGGGTGTLACIDELRRNARCPDLVIVCEPTRLELCTAQVGSRAMRFVVHGVPAHANSKHLGCSATELAIDLAGRLQASTFRRPDRRAHPLLPPASVNIGRIDGGTGATSVAAQCVLEVCTTYHPDDEADLAAAIDAAVAQWRVDHADEPCSVDATLLHDVVPYATSAHDPAVRLLGEHLPGGQFRPRGFPAGSDGRLFDRLLGCPTVIFGPGDIADIHKPDEHVDLTEVGRFADAIASFLLAFPQSNDWKN